MKFYRPLLIVSSFVFISACGQQEPVALTPEQQQLADKIEARQANLQDMGTAMKTMRDEIGRDQPDMTTLFYSAKTIQTYARDLPFWFPTGSGPELGVETDSKAEIWQKPNDFQQLADDLIAASADLVAATDSREAQAIATAYKKTGGACKACHDKYRVPQE